MKKLRSQAAALLRIPLNLGSGHRWCEQNLRITTGAFPGQISFSRTPWLAEPLDAMTSNKHARCIVCSFAIQAGKSFLLKNAAAYHLSQGRSCLLTSHSEPAAEEWSDTELRPFLRANDIFSDIIPRDRTKAQKMRIMLSNGAVWYCKGATLKGGEMESISVPVVMLDELHLYRNQKAIQSASGRTTRFTSPKIICVSQAEPYAGQHAQFFERGTCSEWGTTCAACGQWYALDLSALTWDKEAKTAEGIPDWPRVAESLRYTCPHCSHSVPTSPAQLAKLNAAGSWQATNPAAEPGFFSYHLTAFAYVNAFDLVREYLAALSRVTAAGDFEQLRTFTAKRLSLNWREEQELAQFAVEKKGVENVNLDALAYWEHTGYIYKGVQYATKEEAPLGAHPLVFIGVDVQRSEGLWYVVRAWDINGNSMLLRCGNLATWDELHALVLRYKLPPSNVHVDRSDYANKRDIVQECYNGGGYILIRGNAAYSMQVKIESGKNTTFAERVVALRPVIEQVQDVKPNGLPGCKAVRMQQLSVCVHPVKDQIFALRTQTRRDRGKTRFWFPEELENISIYKKHMAAQKRVESMKGGHIWKQIKDRPDHLNDAETYACAGYLRKLGVASLCWNDETFFLNG